MHLAKLPFILAFTYACHYSGTSPNTSSSKSEKAKYERERRPSELILAFIGQSIKHSIWVESLLEAVLILLCNFSHHPSVRAFISIQSICRFDSGLTVDYSIATLLVIIAALIRRQCYIFLGHMFTFDLSIKRDHHLVQVGPYAFVRHPAYAAFILLNCGVMMTHFNGISAVFTLFPPWLEENYNRFVFWASLWGMYTLTARADLEDAVLRDEFGEEWEIWAGRVRYKFIPWIW